jgi:hypothetical protein
MVFGCSPQDTQRSSFKVKQGIICQWVHEDASRKGLLVSMYSCLVLRCRPRFIWYRTLSIHCTIWLLLCSERSVCIYLQLLNPLLAHCGIYKEKNCLLSCHSANVRASLSSVRPEQTRLRNNMRMEDINKPFGETRRLYLQVLPWRNAKGKPTRIPHPQKCSFSSTRLHGITSQKSIKLIPATWPYMKAWDIIHALLHGRWE